MFKRAVILLFLGVSCFGFAFSQATTITRIAVVDLPRVYTTFFRESQAVRNFEQKSARIQADIERMTKEVQELRSRHADAVSSGNQAEALRLETQVNQRTAFLREFHQTKMAELNAERNQLMQSDEFISQVQNEIRFIAESGGYSMVIDIKNATGIVWYSPSIDITDSLIQRLQSRPRN